jgi:hypothetical protein
VKQWPPGVSVEELMVTTTQGAHASSVARARDVAAACGARFVHNNDSVNRLMRKHGAEVAYVVGIDRTEIRADGGNLLINPATYRLTAIAGPGHPFLRAISPVDEPVAETVLDATLGLAKNALEIAGILGCRVTGLEQVPVLACLAQDGLRRLAGQGMAWSAGAGRIEVISADAERWMAGQDDDAFDVVSLDPMFQKPIGASPGYDLFRRFAQADPLADIVFNQALRVARMRVVLKVPQNADAADFGPDGFPWNRREHGKRIHYLVADKTV